MTNVSNQTVDNIIELFSKLDDCQIIKIIGDDIFFHGYNVATLNPEAIPSVMDSFKSSISGRFIHCHNVKDLKDEITSLIREGTEDDFEEKARQWAIDKINE